MNEIALLEHLENIATRLGVELRYEDLAQSSLRCEGGYCLVSGKPVVFVNRKDSRRRKIRTLAKSLVKLNLESIFIPPAVRRVLETHDS